jgi:hypothetical protein
MVVHTSRPIVQRHLDHMSRHRHQPGIAHHFSHSHGDTDILLFPDGPGEKSADLSDGVIIGECAIVGLDVVVRFNELEPAAWLADPID